MRILFIAPYIPSLIRVRPFNFIKALKEQGHSVYLVSLVTDKKEFVDLEGIEKYCEKIETFYLPKYKSYWNCLRYLFSTVALQSAYCFDRKMSKHIEYIIEKEKFDIIHIEHIRAAHFLPDNCPVPAIYDSVDCISALYEQFYKANESLVMKFVSYVEWLKLKCYEPKVLKKFDRILVTSNIDKEELEEFNTRVPIEIISNGVDLEYFKAKGNGIEPFSVVMTGKMSYIANEVAVIYFMEEIWRKIKKEIPQTRLYIVGSDPGTKIKEYGAHDIIITGYVPDLRLYLSRANVVVAPIVAGGGIQNKILEAMAMARPVVTTGKAAESIKGLVSENSDLGSEAVSIGDTPEEFAMAVINLLKDEKKARDMGARARHFMEKYYSWDEKVRNMVNIYSNVIDKNLL